MLQFDVYNKVDTPSHPALFTPFSLFHFLAGAYAYLVTKWLFPTFPVTYDFVVWIAIHTLYEIKDIFHPDTTNSWINSFGDTITGLAGFVIMAIVFPFGNIRAIDVVVGGILLWIASITIPEPATG